jgi:hypothetical protein
MSRISSVIRNKNMSMIGGDRFEAGPKLGEPKSEHTEVHPVPRPVGEAEDIGRGYDEYDDEVEEGAEEEE